MLALDPVSWAEVGYNIVWNSIHQTILATSYLHSLLTKYSNLFKDELGTVTTYKAALQIQPDTTPKFRKACPILFANKDAVRAKFNCLEGVGILQRVSHSIVTRLLQLWLFQRRI